MTDDEKKELTHYGIPGMHWGYRIAKTSAKATARDADDLRKHGFIKEADAVQKVSDHRAEQARKLELAIERRSKQTLKGESKNTQMLVKSKVRKALLKPGVLGMRLEHRIAKTSAKATARDADDLRKHGFIKEADAVQKVSDHRAEQARKLELAMERIGK